MGCTIAFARASCRQEGPPADPLSPPPHPSLPLLKVLSSMASAGLFEHVLRAMGEPAELLRGAGAGGAYTPPPPVQQQAAAPPGVLAWCAGENGAAATAFGAMGGPGTRDGGGGASGPASSSAAAAAAAIAAGRRFLLLRVPRGRAFAGLLSPEHEVTGATPLMDPLSPSSVLRRGGTLTLTGSLLGHRFASTPVAACAEPAFGAAFLIDLTAPPPLAETGAPPPPAHARGGVPALPPASLMALAQRPSLLELMVTWHPPTGGAAGVGPGHALGRAELDVRRCLVAAGGRVAAPITLLATGGEPPLAAGVLEVK